ncbi:uncharacterized protein LOC123922030 [Trifolium pratense]|uniref:uncharacterized protein LOC123922030 n=1 Tax=Trifolium pratense TaxID=57577 RepID=UPI001E694D60|nr:uncharacterized protein LOC123922030 [Trifolium pratense]
MAYAQPQKETKTIPLKVVVNTYSKKVVFVEATKDFVDTLFSFLSLPPGTIVRLLATTNNNNDQQQLPESSPFLENIKNLYQSVQNITSNDVWNNPACKQILLRPRNPCESMCNELFLNIDDTESTSKFYVCSFCDKFTTFENLNCTCGNPPDRQPRKLDSDGQGNNEQNGIFVRESGPMFLVSDDLKIVPSSLLTSTKMVIEAKIPNLIQLKEVTCNIGEQEILNFLKYALTSHEPLTNTILARSSRNKCNSPNKSASTVGLMHFIGDSRSKMDIKVLQSISQKKIIIAEAGGDFVDFIFSFLTMPLGSIVKLLGANSFAGCVGNLYESVKNLDPTSVLLNPGIAPQFSCPNQPLNIPHAIPPCNVYYYGTETRKRMRDHHYNNTEKEKIQEVISRSCESVFYRRNVTALDPKVGTVGFVKRATLYGVGDDLKVTPLAANSVVSYLKEYASSL